MTKEKIVSQCRQEYDNGTKFKQGRVKDWQASEDLYYGRIKKTQKGRFNIPMPIMSGFIDTLMSKIDDPPSLKFKPMNEADFRMTQKTQAFYDATKNAEDYDLDSKDLDMKKLAAMYGRGIAKVYGESYNGFKFCTHVTDPYDFYVDPLGGGSLENARFLGEANIFKSKSQLIEGANSGLYDKKNVQLLVNNLAENTIKDNDDTQQNKANRFSALGLSNSMYNFMGEGTQKFIESGTIVDGERYYVLWHYESGLHLRCEKIKQVFESGLWWWISWATHRDSFNFWSKAPADDMRPIAEVINVLTNQELDNRQKRNYNQRAYDPEMFPNGAELEFRPNGLVAVKAGSSRVQAIASGIYQFETAELTGTIDLINWMDNIAGAKTGVTAAAQGNADEQKVGIYQGNLQNVADRFGLYNKSYSKFYSALGRRFVWALNEHLNTKQAVRLIGENGVEWDTLKGSEVNPDMDILVETGTTQAQLDQVKKDKRAQALATIMSNPKLMGGVNSSWLIEQVLLNGEFDDESVRVAKDTENNGNREVLARASESIEEIVEGKTPKLFRGATTGFQQKILDFAMDNTDGDLALFNKLIDYARAHDKLVIENMSRKAMQSRARQGMEPLPSSGPNGEPPASGPLAPEATPPAMQDLLAQTAPEGAPQPAAPAGY